MMIENLEDFIDDILFGSHSTEEWENIYNTLSEFCLNEATEEQLIMIEESGAGDMIGMIISYKEKK